MYGYREGATPSTFFGPMEMRYFGKSSFSDYHNGREFPANAPIEMWTAACPVSLSSTKMTTKLVQRVRPFGGKTVLGDSCEKLNVNEMEKRLKRKEITETNLFPFHGQCRDENNYISLS